MVRCLKYLVTEMFQESEIAHVVETIEVRARAGTLGMGLSASFLAQDQLNNDRPPAFKTLFCRIACTDDVHEVKIVAVPN